MANQEMISAIKDGKLDTVKTLFASQGTSNSAQDNDLLYYSVSKNQKDITEFFLAKGCDPNARQEGEFGTIPLEVACSEETVDLLIRYQADVNATSLNGRTPLHSQMAAGYKLSAGIATHLLEAGADPRAMDKNDSTPLHLLLYSLHNGFREPSVISPAAKEIIINLVKDTRDASLLNQAGTSLESFLKTREKLATYNPDYAEDKPIIKEIRNHLEGLKPKSTLSR